MPKRKQPQTPALSTEQRVLQVLCTLNQATDESVLRDMAQYLQLTARVGAVADLPRARGSGSRTARRELVTLANHAGDLITHIHGMHSDALRAFERVESRGQLHPLMMAKELLALADAAILAQESLLDTPPHKGNRPKRQAQEVTRVACKLYKRLTGKPAGRATAAYIDGRPYGPLHDFLKDLFTVLEIHASPDGQLKTFLALPRGKNAFQIIQ